MHLCRHYVVAIILHHIGLIEASGLILCSLTTSIYCCFSDVAVQFKGHVRRTGCGQKVDP